MHVPGRELCPPRADQLPPALLLSAHLGQDGDAEGLVGGLPHQVEGQDRKDVPGGGADLPANQLLPQPEAVWELLCLPEGKGR